MELAVNKVIALIICCFLMACERHQGVENNQINGWVDDNSALLVEFANKSAQVNASGELAAIKGTMNLKANFSSNAEQDSFNRIVAELFSKLNYSDVKLSFNLGLKNKHKSICITLYQNGFCASLGDCLDTFLVYYLDSKDLILDKNYIYTSMTIEGWYLLKVSND